LYVAEFESIELRDYTFHALGQLQFRNKKLEMELLTSPKPLPTNALYPPPIDHHAKPGLLPLPIPGTIPPFHKKEEGPGFRSKHGEEYHRTHSASSSSRFSSNNNHNVHLNSLPLEERVYFMLTAKLHRVLKEDIDRLIGTTIVDHVKGIRMKLHQQRREQQKKLELQQLEQQQQQQENAEVYQQAVDSAVAAPSSSSTTSIVLPASSGGTLPSFRGSTRSELSDSSSNDDLDEDLHISRKRKPNRKLDDGRQRFRRRIEEEDGEEDEDVFVESDEEEGPEMVEEGESEEESEEEEFEEEEESDAELSEESEEEVLVTKRKRPVPPKRTRKRRRDDDDDDDEFESEEEAESEEEEERNVTIKRARGKSKVLEEPESSEEEEEEEEPESESSEEEEEEVQARKRAKQARKPTQKTRPPPSTKTKVEPPKGRTVKGGKDKENQPVHDDEDLLFMQLALAKKASKAPPKLDPNQNGNLFFSSHSLNSSFSSSFLLADIFSSRLDFEFRRNNRRRRRST
jgi:hypothetical protein